MATSVTSYRRCAFEVDDNVHEKVNNGLVTILGPAASLWRFDSRMRRYQLLDRLTKITQRDTDDGFVLMGVSKTLVEIGATGDAARIAVHVMPRGCETCK